MAVLSEWQMHPDFCQQCDRGLACVSRGWPWAVHVGSGCTPQRSGTFAKLATEFPRVRNQEVGWRRSFCKGLARRWSGNEPWALLKSANIIWRTIKALEAGGQTLGGDTWSPYKPLTCACKLANCDPLAGSKVLRESEEGKQSPSTLTAARGAVGSGKTLSSWGGGANHRAGVAGQK